MRMHEATSSTSVHPESIALDAVPVPTVRAEPLGSDLRIQLLSPRYRDPLIRRFVMPCLPPDMRWDRYPLDTRGSRIWRLIDGQRTVAELIAEYQWIYPDDTAQVTERVGRFLLTLQRHRFIDLRRD
jgi:hypothetical protein